MTSCNVIIGPSSLYWMDDESVGKNYHFPFVNGTCFSFFFYLVVYFSLCLFVVRTDFFLGNIVETDDFGRTEGSEVDNEREEVARRVISSLYIVKRLPSFCGRDASDGGSGERG